MPDIEAFARTKSIAPKIALFFMFMLLPGFFIYHAQYQFVRIPLFLGNGWTLLNIVCSITAVFMVLIGKIDRRVLLDPLVALIIAIVVYALFYRLNGLDYQASEVAFIENAKLAFRLFSMYIIGYYIMQNQIDPRVLTSLFFIMLFLIGISADLPNNMYDPSTIEITDPASANYQAMGRSFSTFFFFALVFSKSTTIGYALFLSCVIGLYYTGARSELVSITAVFLVWGTINILVKINEYGKGEFKFEVGKGLRVAVVTLLFMFAMAYPYVQEWAVKAWKDLTPSQSELVVTPRSQSEPRMDVPPQADAPEDDEERIKEILDLEVSKSWLVRKRLFLEGINDIKENPILGNYAGQLEQGTFGDYIHNVLSSWRQFGIIGFSIYMYIICKPLIKSIGRTRNMIFLPEKITAPETMAYYLSIFTVIMVCVFKSIYWEIPALLWGVTRYVEDGGRRR